jgi:uncharacterized membrane-anchored protein
MSSRGAIRCLLLVLIGALLVLGTPRASAEPSAPEGAASAESAKPPSAWRQGPAEVALEHDIKLALADRHAFLPKEQASKFLEANGSLHNEDVLGLVASASHSSEWFVVIQFDKAGYVKDDEKIDAEELLKSLREGNDEANKERKEKGFPALALDGWSDPPHYDRTVHHLVWALVVSDTQGKSVNYNTRILGRHGFVSLILVTDPSKLEGFKPEAQTLLAGTQFQKGARYEDFDSSKDKVAEYGLAGLIAAGAGLGAAKLIKIGLIAKFWKVIVVALVAGKKFVVLALAGLGAWIKRALGQRSKNIETPPSA